MDIYVHALFDEREKIFEGEKMMQLMCCVLEHVGYVNNKQEYMVYARSTIDAFILKYTAYR